PSSSSASDGTLLQSSVLRPASTARDEDLAKFNETTLSLPKHSYWFDFWLFIAFDVVFFLIMYFLVP
uniref:Uncharacterized protein n=1 Tax=Hippocampus comes TaxID=109280 RepID=A0A3Q2XVX2_HIPCM